MGLSRKPPGLPSMNYKFSSEARSLFYLPAQKPYPHHPDLHCLRTGENITSLALLAINYCTVLLPVQSAFHCGCHKWLQIQQLVTSTDLVFWQVCIQLIRLRCRYQMDGFLSGGSGSLVSSILQTATLGRNIAVRQCWVLGEVSAEDKNILQMIRGALKARPQDKAEVTTPTHFPMG